MVAVRVVLCLLGVLLVVDDVCGDGHCVMVRVGLLLCGCEGWRRKGSWCLQRNRIGLVLVLKIVGLVRGRWSWLVGGIA